MKFVGGSILTINGGSSSIKFAIFESEKQLRKILEGAIERIGLSESAFRVAFANQENEIAQKILAPDYKTAIQFLMNWLEKNDELTTLIAIGHRVVHGGPLYNQPELITLEMIKNLKSISPFDPEHLPVEILIMKSFFQRFPDLPQVACFDTHFHYSMPRVAQILPIPRRFEVQGLRRYGFHGLSYEFLMKELTRLVGVKAAGGRIILAHLGSGASLAAVHKRKPVDTSMGFTPASGLPMGTRSGDLDPGLFSFLVHSDGFDADKFSEMVNFQSGLLGVSEISSDMRDLLKFESSDDRAAEAIEMFCYQTKKWIGSFAAILGGLDTLVFTGGIGERSATIRARICSGLEFLGIEIDKEKNLKNRGSISAKKGRVDIHVIRADEEKMIASWVSRVIDPTNKYHHIQYAKKNKQHNTKEGHYVN